MWIVNRNRTVPHFYPNLAQFTPKRDHTTFIFFTTWRYASALLAMAASVCHKSEYCQNKLRWFWKLSLTYATLCYKGFGISTKIGIFPSGTLSETGGRSRLLTTPTTVDCRSWANTSLLHVHQPQCCNSITSICCGLIAKLGSSTAVQQLTTFWQTDCPAFQGSRASCSEVLVCCWDFKPR